MKDCHEDFIAFHNKEVTLPGKEQGEMRKRRNTNRDRLESGLNRDGEPLPIECRSQGSYPMYTMVQQPDRDYDIDDGIYFELDDLKGPRGGDKSTSDAKEMVRKALHTETFRRAPEVRTNCVRVYYNEGYHVDLPVYRRVSEEDSWTGQSETWDELASTDWKRSDPLAVTAWFLEENKRQSPDTQNGRQLRRIVRLLKAYARSRPSWRGRIASGFMITKLVVDEYRADANREDLSLVNTMSAILSRLSQSLEIEHPTVSGEMLTKGPNDARSKMFREKLDWAIQQLNPLWDPRCTREEALKAWDKVFDTSFFEGRSQQQQDDEEDLSLGAGLGTAPLVRRSTRDTPKLPVDKQGGGRFG